MKEKNGFTRVELSGIVLIIIIIIIIFITIGNVIMKARENAFKNSVYGVIDGVRLLSISQQLQGKSPEVTITFQNKKPNDSAFKVSGDFPDKGTIHLNKEGTIELKLWNKKLKRCIEKTVKQDDIMITNTKEDDCKIEITDIPTNIPPHIYRNHEIVR